MHSKSSTVWFVSAAPSGVFEVIAAFAPGGFLQVRKMVDQLAQDCAAHEHHAHDVQNVRAAFCREFNLKIECKIEQKGMELVASRSGWFSDELMGISLAMVGSGLQLTELLSNNVLRGLYRVGYGVGKHSPGEFPPSFAIWGAEEAGQRQLHGANLHSAVLSSDIYPLSKTFSTYTLTTYSEDLDTGDSPNTSNVFETTWALGTLWSTSVLPLNAGAPDSNECQSILCQSILGSVRQRSELWKKNVIAFPAMEESHWVGVAVTGLPELAKYLTAHDHLLTGSEHCSSLAIIPKPEGVAVLVFDSNRSVKKEQEETTKCLQALGVESLQFLAGSENGDAGGGKTIEEKQPRWSLHMLRKLFDFALACRDAAAGGEGKTSTAKEGQSKTPYIPEDVKKDLSNLNLQKLGKKLERNSAPMGLLQKASHIAIGLAATWVIHRRTELDMRQLPTGKEGKEPHSQGDSDSTTKDDDSRSQEFSASTFRKWARRAWEDEKGHVENRSLMSAVLSFAELIERELLCLHVDIPQQKDDHQCGPLALLAIESFLSNESFRTECRKQMAGIYGETFSLGPGGAVEYSSAESYKMFPYSEDSAFALRVRLALFVASLYQETIPTHETDGQAGHAEHHVHDGSNQQDCENSDAKRHASNE